MHFGDIIVDFFPQAKSFNIELINPATKKYVVLDNVPSCTLPEPQKIQQSVIAGIPNYITREISSIKIDTAFSIATTSFQYF